MFIIIIQTNTVLIAGMMIIGPCSYRMQEKFVAPHAAWIATALVGLPTVLKT